MGKEEQEQGQEEGPTGRRRSCVTGSTSRANLRASAVPKKVYEEELARLQVELVKLQEWIKAKGLKVVVIFEGRDAAGKGGVIKRITESLNPRVCRVVALGTPTEREKTQWYFQRYVPHLPAAGEMVLFDRSWYNRAGVERVMGFCTEEEYREFLRSCPEFERMLVRSGIILIKYWFSVSDEEQERRFQARIDDPTKRWKLSPMDLRVARALGRVLEGQGRHVRLHRHQAGPLVRGQRRRQEAGPAQLHHPPAEPDPLRGPDAPSRSSCRRARRTRATSVRRSPTRPSCPRSTDRPTRMDVLKVHPDDNVLVALRDLAPGATVTCEGETYALPAGVRAKHKVVTRDLAPGEAVVMYGVLVGRAVRVHRPGHAGHHRERGRLPPGTSRGGDAGARLEPARRRGLARSPLPRLSPVRRPGGHGQPLAGHSHGVLREPERERPRTRPSARSSATPSPMSTGARWPSS